MGGRLGAYLKGVKGVGRAVKVLQQHKVSRRVVEGVLKNRNQFRNETKVIIVPGAGGGLNVWGGYKSTEISVYRVNQGQGE